MPTLGLCNRMRSIDSAIALTEEFNFELIVIWVKNRNCKAAFYDLFQHSSYFKVIEIDSIDSVKKKIISIPQSKKIVNFNSIRNNTLFNYQKEV